MVVFLVGLIPANPVQAAVDGALLPLVVFTVLLAAAAGTLPEPRRRPLMSLAEALATLLRDEARRRVLGEAGRRRFEERFTVDRMVDETVRVLREVA